MNPKQKTIQEIRAFNRYYTDLIGLLDSHLLNSAYSLSEARILYELHTNEQVTASQIMAILNIDKGYLSRIIKKFEKDGLVSRVASPADARISFLSLTGKGTKVFHELNEASNAQIDLLIKTLPSEKQGQLVEHMKAIVKILSP